MSGTWRPGTVVMAVVWIASICLAVATLVLCALDGDWDAAPLAFLALLGTAISFGIWWSIQPVKRRASTW